MLKSCWLASCLRPIGLSFKLIAQAVRTVTITRNVNQFIEEGGT